MSRRDFWICIEILVVTFMMGVVVGMCIQVLGVPVNACAEMESNEGGYVSGMPCENPEQFERWYANYEQETIEEEAGEVSNVEMGEEMETAQSDNVRGASQSEVVYSVNGETLNPELQAMLYDALDRHGVGYWFEVAICQCYQESRFSIYAENPNGKDKGILQYRLQYWDWNRGDIFDPAAQFELYAEQMAARLNAGLSVDECISRHNTSDFVNTVNWEYVGQVKQWLSTLKNLK